MNVTLQKTKGQNGLILIEIVKADYAPKVEATLLNYRKTARIPGFRPGMAPMGMIQRQYSRAIQVDEVNKLLQDSLFDYIEKEKLDILGQPLPVPQEGLDWDTESMKFSFEIGLAPEIKLEIGEKVKLPFYTIEVGKKVLDEESMQLRKRYGKLSEPESPKEDDLFFGLFQQVGADGQPTEGGISKEGRFSGTVVADKKWAKSLLASEKNQPFAIDAVKSFAKDFHLESVLGISADALAEAGSSFAFTLKNIYRNEPAALDQELFDKVFGPGVVTDEAGLREKIQAELEGMYKRDVDVHFFNTVSAHLMKTKMDLPVEFLKKWLQQSGEKPLTAEEVEAQWPSMERGMKWQLIENKIVKENHLHVHKEELVDFAMNMVSQRMTQFGQAIPAEEMEKIALNLLKNREQAEQISEQILQEKMNAFFKKSFGLKETKASYEDFIKLASNKD